ncbi:MAG: hypothetical protein ACOCZK_07140 [Planctomycetota bacterium]
MPTTCVGIDEAGYGPTLGPLVIVGVAAAASDLETLQAACARCPLGVKDSKRLHVSGNIAPLESVALAALAWLGGRPPATAAELFTTCGEDPADAALLPWLGEADGLCLPLRSRRIAEWSIPGVRPVQVRARIVQPSRLNDAMATGRNKADLVLETVCRLLAGWAAASGRLHAVVDRLGGRHYYATALEDVLTDARCHQCEEGRGLSRYDFVSGEQHARIEFRVKADRDCILTAMASCIAKYVREVHMQLFNRWWSRRRPDLAPTAGYPQDAARWLDRLGPETLQSMARVLVRGPVYLETA